MHITVCTRPLVRDLSKRQDGIAGCEEIVLDVAVHNLRCAVITVDRYFSHVSIRRFERRLRFVSCNGRVLLAGRA